MWAPDCTWFGCLDQNEFDQFVFQISVVNVLHILSYLSVSVPLYIFAGYAVVACVLLLIFFKTDYKRVEAERTDPPVVTESTLF